MATLRHWSIKQPTTIKEIRAWHRLMRRYGSTRERYQIK